ncbi:MAG: extracellular solute-binding protein [Clostridia bacterium]|nr:extracellular solute-binding protein [Clostridia bacterium]
MKHKAKKLISLILAILMFIAAFTGCTGGETGAAAFTGTAGKEAGPLKICVDLGSFREIYDPAWANQKIKGDQHHAMMLFEADFKAYLQMNGLDPIELEIEYIPEYIEGGNIERETTISRLRTEIMSGKGPDIFLMGSNDREIEPLFIVPEKNMVNGAFLPLNDYIENAEFMEFDKLVPGIMSAGQYDGEQYILPLTYTMPLTFYNQDEVHHTASKKMTWEQMLEGEDYLRNAAYAFCPDEDTYLIGPFLLNSFGQIADYKNDKLLLTEDELLKRTEELIALEHERFYSEGTASELPTNWQIHLSYGFERFVKWRGVPPESAFFDEETAAELPPLEDPYTIVPMYSDDGGVMATILTYAAINANTKQPEKAFYVLDYLFGLKSQQSSSVFQLTCVDAIPVHMDLLQEAYPLTYIGTYNLHEGTYKALREVQENITGAAFSNVFFYELDAMYYKCGYAKRKGENYEEIVAETYNMLKQIVAE